MDPSGTSPCTMGIGPFVRISLKILDWDNGVNAFGIGFSR